MSKKEILITRYGEMTDMITCYAIFNGAEPKKKKSRMTFEQAMLLN